MLTVLHVRLLNTLLVTFIEQNVKNWSLTPIDIVPDCTIFPHGYRQWDLLMIYMYMLF